MKKKPPVERENPIVDDDYKPDAPTSAQDKVDAELRKLEDETGYRPVPVDPAPPAPPPSAPVPAPVAAARPALAFSAAKALSLDVGAFRRLAGAIVHAVPKDKDSPLMSSLHVRLRGKELIIEASNGHWFARWRIEHAQYAAKGDDGAFCIPGERVKEFLKLLPHDEEQLDLFRVKTVTITRDALEGPGVRLDYEHPQGDYPDIDKLEIFRRGPRKPFASIGRQHVASTYLIAASKVIEAAGDEVAFLELGAKEQDMISMVAPTVPGLLIGIMPRPPSPAPAAPPATE